MEKIDYDQLNPGIRRTVKMLRDAGFNTCDSGDGVTHEFECDRDHAYVSIRVIADQLITEVRRLKKFLEDKGFEVNQYDEDGIEIDGLFAPDGMTDLAIVDVRNLSDSLLQVDMKKV